MQDGTLTGYTFSEWAEDEYRLHLEEDEYPYSIDAALAYATGATNSK